MDQCAGLFVCDFSHKVCGALCRILGGDAPYQPGPRNPSAEHSAQRRRNGAVTEWGDTTGIVIVSVAPSLSPALAAPIHLELQG